MKSSFLRLRRVTPQLILLGFLTLLHLLALQGVLPSPESLTIEVEELFSRHGLPLVALCSFLENIVGVNAYFPGSIAILAGMALTAGDPTRAFQMYLTIMLPALAANQVSYWLGRRLRRIPNVPPDAPRQAKLWALFLLTYWHPHLAATTAMVSGTRRLPYCAFLRYFLVASLFWSIVWALVIYYFGQALNIRSNFTFLFYIYLILWLAWDLVRIPPGTADKSAAVLRRD